MAVIQVVTQSKFMATPLFNKTGIMLLLVLVIFISCSEPNDSGSRQGYHVEQIPFSIQHGDKIISNKSVFTKLIGEDSLIYYEQSERTFYLFDLKNRVLKDFLKFEFHGPNFIEDRVLDFDKIGDQYVILSPNYISFSDHNAQIIRRKGINQFLNNMEDASIFKINNFKVLNDNELYLSQSPRAVIAPFENNGSNPPIFAIYKIREDSIEDLRIFSPEETLINDDTQGFYGSDSQHFFILNNNCIIFNFQFSPSIYRYSLESKQLTKFAGKTTKFAEATEPIPADKYRDPAYLVKHMLRNSTRFSNIEYDAENDIYIRFASRKTYNEELKRSKNELYLQIFDSAFSNVFEQEVLISGRPEVYLSKNLIYMMEVGSSQTNENETKFTEFDLRNF